MEFLLLIIALPIILSLSYFTIMIFFGIALDISYRKLDNNIYENNKSKKD